MIKLSSLKPLENNPFKKKDDDQIKKIGESIKSFERMMSIRKIIIDENNEILGGNKRFFALKKLGYKEIPDEWVEQVIDLTEEQKKEFIVKDNAHWGSEWDVEMLNDWGVDFDAWGVGIEEEKEKSKEEGIEGEIQFSEELERANNYIVLKFNTDIDFIYAQTLFGLESKYAKRQNGKAWSKGIGRVVDGVDAIEKIKKS